MKNHIVGSIFFPLFFCLLLSGCYTVGNGSPDQAVVTVDNMVLTLGELANAIPDNISTEDSMVIAEDYVGKWVRSRLMLRQAESNLSAEEKNVDQLLEEYRTSLLVHRYQQKMLEQRHSPLVTSREIENYYNQMKENFNLHENIIQGLFIKVPIEVPNQAQLRSWLKSGRQEDILNIEAYSFQYARKYDQFIENWIPFSRINLILPAPILNENNFLRYSGFYNSSDDSYNYYLAIYDYKLAGDTSPLQFVEDRIKAILLNKKRTEFLNQLSQDLYDEGLRDKTVNFH